MKNTFAARRYFTRQSGPDDCGLACLCMILNYTGREGIADQLFADTGVPVSGFSLLGLRKLAAASGLDSECVSMDLETLRISPQPVILYLNNESGEGHFAVCFGTENRNGRYFYLIGDPATDVTFVPEKQLIDSWPRSAALYFPDIHEQGFNLKSSAVASLLRVHSFRKTLLLTVPFLNISSTLLGVGLSWLLQRGISDSFTDKRTSLLTAIIVLLLIITIFKSLLSFIKQHVLIKLNSTLSAQLNREFIHRVLTGKRFSGIGVKELRKGFADIQKIQNAISAFVAVLFSDGTIIAFIVAGIWYYLPLAGICDTVYLAAMLSFAIFRMPEMAFHSAQLNELSGILENELSDDTGCSTAGAEVESRVDIHLLNHNRHMEYARSVSVKISRHNLIYECIGTLNVIIILVICLQQNRQSALSYGSLMAIVILSYFVTALMPRICNAWSVVSEGAALIRRYQSAEPNT